MFWNTTFKKNVLTPEWQQGEMAVVKYWRVLSYYTCSNLVRMQAYSTQGTLYKPQDYLCEYNIQNEINILGALTVAKIK